VTSILYDQGGARWHSPYLKAAGISEALLSPLAPSAEVVGRLTRQAASALGLSTDTLVVNGAHDQYCAALGTGVLQPGQMVLSCGTAWVLFVPLAAREAALELGLLVGPHLEPGVWGAMVDLYAFGLTPEWFVAELSGGLATDAQAGDRYNQFNSGAATSPPGANGVLFIPLGSGQTPFGAMLRLAPHHTHGDVSRALMEGLAFEVRYQCQRLAASGIEVSDIKAVGGAMESPVWPQVIADVLQTPLALMDGQAAAALGAAILAGAGAGLFSSLSEGVSVMCSNTRGVPPDPKVRARYDQAYAEYQQGVAALLSMANMDTQGGS
jgi:xylulokinase